jgi:signal transduction histidine kinase
MPSRWYRSLYWRIAFGFVLTLAAMLVVQAMLFVWVLSRGGPRLPGEPDRFAETVASDLSQALESDSTLDVAAFLKDQYDRDAHPFFVMLADGRVVGNSSTPLPEPLMRAARARLQRRPGIEGGPPPFDRPRRGRFGRGDPGGRGFGPPGPPPLVPVIVNGNTVAVVVVLPEAPFTFLLTRYAPTLAIVALGALGAGAVIAAVLIFGPARRRLREVEAAARRLGAGDLSARAPDRGGDEVAAVASAFNAMADDLAARAEALAAADRARRHLLADVSHELNTPVTAMRGYLETLTMADFDLDDATRARYLRIVGDETARLERIIRDLLDLARLEGGGGTLVVEDVPIEDLFARVAGRHERACTEAGVRMTTVVEPGATTARADRGRLEQALQNLAANAIRYAPRGSTVELRARPLRLAPLAQGEVLRLASLAQGEAGDGDGHVVLTVTDEGPGIPPEHLAHVFDRFYKTELARAAAAESPGSGLGLSIVKAIVQRHGGTITVTSRPGRTVFEVRI